MSENKKDNQNKNIPKINPGDKKKGSNNFWIYGLILLGIIALNLFVYPNNNAEETTFFKFIDMVKQNDVKKIEVINKSVANVYLKKESKDKYPELKDKKSNIGGPDFTFEIGDMRTFDQQMMQLRKEGYQIDPILKTKQDWVGPVLNWLLPIVILIALWMFLMRRMGAGGGPGGQIFSIGKSRAALFDKNSKVNVTFKDVAGLKEAKQEVMEVVDFLKNPKKYTTLGGKIPKGVLLVGPPGTGKTLLAKAVAGEADVPFFSISGSDFVEMFVGVGASRVRDLFKQAREKAPCIVFIDEIDAIGRSRAKGSMPGGNDERENTLNQLLVEMDGFKTDAGVILMAATNRPDVLDPALLRPGRFDRQIGIDLPDLKEREEIFEVHLKDIKTCKEVDTKYLSEMTPGFAGADIANVCNEAALVAARVDKKCVQMEDFNYALDRVIGGLEKRNKFIPPKEKRTIAYHEAGHAICGWFLENASPLVKVTIIPRGMGALGYAQYLPKEEYIVKKDQLLDRMAMTLGGRAAEKVVFDKISTGAQNDLDRATQLAYNMIIVYGMDDTVGNVSFYGMSKDTFSKPYSETTGALIDDRAREIIEEQYLRAQKLLKDKRKELDILAETLLEKEVLTKTDVEKLIGKRPFPEDHLIPTEEEYHKEDDSDKTDIS
ncbi:MAG TPA: ATP-dependent metallopeptidase FtsH/Yme1/Tma family protein [Bacteroidetes bacterium]|nr:ATP-dependent metallopeptidase FtsH/Yme1/Tma family protein [Bacteroidota bacterium]